MHARGACSVESAWDSLVHRRGEWWPELEFEPAVDARVTERWIDDGDEQIAEGTVLAVEAPARLQFAWTEHGWVGRAVVTITIDATTEGTVVTVEETGLLAASGNHELLDAHRQGWSGHIARLLAHAAQ